MMDYRDYYETLAVGRDADQKEIRRAFRRLARQHHPDLNPGDPEAEERFKEINEAYEVLSDPEKRAKYDQLGSEWSRWQQAGGHPRDFDWGRWTSGVPSQGGQRVRVRYGTPEDLEDLFGGASPFSDFFAQLFGGMGASGAARQAGSAGGFEYEIPPRRGRDYEQEVEISLREAWQGTTRVLQQSGRRLEVKIPPGVREGTRIRMSKEGEPGTAGGEAGDLYLRVRVKPDHEFERRGDDLYITTPVDLYTAVLGGEVPVPTLNGTVMLTIPAGTQNGRRFRLHGKGMPHLQKPEQHGDLYAAADVRLPENLTPGERELFEELRRFSEGEAR